MTKGLTKRVVGRTRLPEDRRGEEQVRWKAKICAIGKFKPSNAVRDVAVKKTVGRRGTRR